MGKLTKTQIIKLIHLYRSHELLWNMNVDSYRRNDLKIKALAKIGEEMCLPVDIVKKKIRSLRSTYTGEKKKILQRKKESNSAADAMHVTSLFWFKEMSFLDSSIVTRNSCDNLNQEATFKIKKEPKKDETKPQRNEILNKTIQHLEQRTKKPDEASTLSATWETLFRKLEPRQQLYANKAIIEVLYQGALENLNEYSCKALESSHGYEFHRSRASTSQPSRTLSPMTDGNASETSITQPKPHQQDYPTETLFLPDVQIYETISQDSSMKDFLSDTEYS